MNKTTCPCSENKAKDTFYLMGIIWLIETPNSENSVAERLCSNFPVRTIASLDSAGKLLSLEKQFLPDLIIYRCAKNTNLSNAEHLLRCYTEKPVVFLTNDDPYSIDLEKKLMVFPLSLQITDLYSLVRRLMGETQANSELRHRMCKFKGLKLDLTSQYLESRCGAVSERLPAKEAGILRVLMESEGQCITREQLTERIWMQVKVGPRTVDAHVSRLRKRLSASGVEIENIYGSGYQLK